MNAFEKTGEVGIIRNFIFDKNIVFDIGANAGEWSREVLKEHPNSIIHLFEPIPKFYQSILQKFDGLIKTRQIKVNCCAVSETEINKQLYFYSSYPRMSTFYRRCKEVEKKPGVGCPELLTVSTVTIDNYCKRVGVEYIHFLKIDTEGAEFDVIKGAAKLLADHRIKFLQFEYGGCFLDAGIRLQEVYEYLTQRNYNVLKISSSGLNDIKRFSSSFEDYEWTNFLAISKK